MPLETSMEYEEAMPNPEHLIKSIAEQGYTLETALADLLDNSISANAQNIEIMSTNLENKLKLLTKKLEISNKVIFKGWVKNTIPYLKKSKI